MGQNLSTEEGAPEMAYSVRVTGIAIFVFSIITLAVGAAPYGFLETNKVGGFWAAIPTLLLSVLAQYPTSRPMMYYGLIFSFVAGLISLVAFSIDGSHASVILASGCYSPATGQTWGRSSNIITSASCPVSSNAECVCAAYTDSCYQYILSSGSDCGTLWSIYYPELVASSVIGSVLCLLCMIIFFFYLVSIGRPNPNASASTPAPIQTFVTPAGGQVPMMVPPPAGASNMPYAGYQPGGGGVVSGGGYAMVPTQTPYDPAAPSAPSAPGMQYSYAQVTPSGGVVPPPGYVYNQPSYYPAPAGAPQMMPQQQQMMMAPQQQMMMPQQQQMMMAPQQQMMMPQQQQMMMAPQQQMMMAPQQPQYYPGAAQSAEAQQTPYYATAQAVEPEIVVAEPIN